eukprot:2029772-Ditylum_brightwellii.AAC.1
MATSRIFPHVMETRHNHLTQMNFWISWNLVYGQGDVGSLLCKDLIPWAKACASLWSSVLA